MNLLLDTHVLVWWAVSDPRLSSPALSAISDASQVHFSLISFWELCLKTHKTRHDLPFEKGDLKDLRVGFLTQGFTELNLDSEVCYRAAALPQHHRDPWDPWDRMIIATAKHRKLTVVSNDSKFKNYPVDLLW